MSTIEKVNQRIGEGWKKEVLTDKKTAGVHLYESRNVAAHVISEKGKINNPDNSDDYKRIQKDIHIIRELADEVFRQKLL